MLMSTNTHTHTHTSAAGYTAFTFRNENQKGIDDDDDTYRFRPAVRESRHSRNHSPGSLLADRKESSLKCTEKEPENDFATFHAVNRPYANMQCGKMEAPNPQSDFCKEAALFIEQDVRNNVVMCRNPLWAWNIKSLLYQEQVSARNALEKIREG